MSSIIGLNAGFAGTGPYRITSPTVEVDATGGTVEVDNNSKFSTNLPVGMGMLITDVEWVVAMIDSVGAPTASAGNIWQVLAQLTEALARKVVAQSDPVDVDIYFDEIEKQERQDTAVGDAAYILNRQKALERHHLWRPWLSVGQQLNLICSVIPTENTTQPGGEWAVFTRIYFDLVALTAAQQAYLAQRIQISGQA